MNITFQPLNAAYRPSVTVPSKQKPRSEKIKGDYDTVNIRKAQAALEDDESFARLLAKKTAAQLGDGAYQPDAQRIAGRLLGLS